MKRSLRPFLINREELSPELARDITKDWLDRCNEIQWLDVNTKQKIKRRYKGGAEKG